MSTHFHQPWRYRALTAGRIWAAKRYVDARRIGIWGWSYGGYMTLKVVELAAGLHSLAMSVAVCKMNRMSGLLLTERAACRGLAILR